MIVVTGGSGFIGSVLVRKLLERGEKVKVIDLSPPRISHKNLTWVKASILDDITEDLKGCDILFHFAAFLGVDASLKNPLKTLEIDLIGSRNIFKIAHDLKIKKIIFSSSSEVYGEPREIPIKETTAKGPVSTYGVAKLASEMYAMAYFQENNTDIRIVRFFNVYGPGQSPQFVMALFLKGLLEGKAPKIYGDGSQSRCFTYIDDAIEGVFTVLEKGKAGEVYNVGNNKPTTILELANLAVKVSGKNITPVTVPFGADSRPKEREINYRQPDVSKMNSIGWQPKIFVEEGMKKTYEWMKESMKN